MEVAVRQRATETSSAGIRRCAYLLFTAIHPRFRPTDLASVGLLPESYQRQQHPTSPPTLRRSACCLKATTPNAIPLPTDLASVGLLPESYQRQHHPTSPPTLRRSACCLTATRQRVELPTSENANEGSDSCSVKHSEAMGVAVRQRATETSSAGIRRCAYLLPSTRVFAPPTLRRSACCLTATRRPAQFRSPPTLRRSACCLTATRQRVELPTSENANGGSDSCSVKHSEAMRVAVRQRATETSSAGIRRCAYLLFTAIHPRFRPTDLASVGLLPESYQRPTQFRSPPTLRRSACCLKATRRPAQFRSPPTLRRSACCLNATSARRNSAPHRPCVGRLAA